MNSGTDKKYPPARTLETIVAEGSRTKLIFLTFITQTCPGCKETYEALRDFSRKLEDQVEIVVVDADRHMPLVDDYGVLGVPTIFVYGRQRHLFTETGPRSVWKLKKMFKRAKGLLAV